MNPNTIDSDKAPAAVAQNGSALQYVRDQTPAICAAAVKQDGYALRFVRDDSTYDTLAANGHKEIT